jgi:hypothetical protein
VNKDYLKILNDFITRFKLWKPNVYIYIEGGNMQYVYADSDVHLSLFDDDNEKETPPKYRDKESYSDRKETWNWMIQSGINDGSLKEVF